MVAPYSKQCFKFIQRTNLSESIRTYISILKNIIILISLENKRHLLILIVNDNISGMDQIYLLYYN